MSEREPMMCVSCGTVLGCDCTRTDTGRQQIRSIADAHYAAGWREGQEDMKQRAVDACQALRPSDEANVFLAAGCDKCATAIRSLEVRDE